MTATLAPEAAVVPLRRNRRFQTLWAGSASAMLGTCLADTAYPLLLLAMTGSPTVAGAFGAVQFGASVLFGLHGGTVADRHDRRRILILADTVRLLTALSVALALAADRLTVPHALLAAAVIGATMAYGGPSRMLALRAVVPPEQLRQALSQDELRVNGAALAGPPLAGFLLGLGTAVPFLATVLTSGLALGASVAVRFDSRPGAQAPMGGREKGGREKGGREKGAAFAGLRYLFAHRVLRGTVLVAAALNLTGSAMLLAVMVLLRDHGTSQAGIGLALTGEAVGGLLGALLVSRLHRLLGPGALLLAVAWSGAAAFAVPAVAAGPVVVFAALALTSLGVPALRVMLDVLVFQRVPEEVRGRAMAGTMTLLMAGLPLGTMTAGLLLDRLPAATVLVLLAAALAAALLPLTLGRSLRGTGWNA
ncbi:MFS transporter [Kitasatospora cineracea]|uniref:Putative MFS family arabinose efflux permease n=1 Tax=Kitasatospora cineracea TaxID=88074 RepID=A0A8G1XBH8_9ACTN|nr:MFS transporter [Kitasatospora cineracea]ROR43714.1 putative MFS family arabinose efflux permease [Kitasatospora cineracea]